ncbi:MAG: T9SS type A sorting domain-containing protein [Melioribacteraceae bacterium]|nr:T9SS type A sorting domain-containing protein [Melioribacteraceae bacterium]MCF8355033.1 T9SS type A sorting domain-containing protein [Melioribacteraceae bacterium]MCF8392712.1 T9SS type A sorting domain-containing protein [Melioribacteraceae bacterium]MCF8417734.1 T9SS type A sorting domain-containing protein [Melioribacteraceae bacterium]
MKKASILVFAALLWIVNISAQTGTEHYNVTDISGWENSNSILTGAFTVANSPANERAPFLVGSDSILYAIFEYTQPGELTKIAIFSSEDDGVTWQPGNNLSADGRNLVLPQAYIEDDDFYIVFQSIDTLTQNSDIVLFEHNESGNEFYIIDNSDDNTVRPSLIVKDSEVSCAYFNFTSNEFIIKEENDFEEFETVFINNFYHPDGFLRIDATSGGGVDMFVYNADNDGVNQIVIMERTRFAGWVQRYITSSNITKHSPTIASYGTNWIMTFQQGNNTKYIYKRENQSISNEKILATSTSFPTIDVFDAFGGMIVAVFEKQGTVKKKVTTFENLPGWGDETALYDDPIIPSDDDFIGLWPFYQNGGALFASLNESENYDIYFTPLNEIIELIAKPSLLTATVVDTLNVSLQWIDNSLNEDGFKIYRKDGYLGYWREVATVAADVQTFFDDSLRASTDYCYKVRAFSSTGISPYSNLACATTLRNFTQNRIDYSFNILLTETFLGNLSFNVSSGTFFEGETYLIPEFEFVEDYVIIQDAFDAIEGAVFDFGNITNEDIFIEVYLVFNFGLGAPSDHFGETMFMEMWIKVYQMPGFIPVVGDYPFNEGEYMIFSLVKDTELIVFLSRQGMNPNSVKFVYITDTGLVANGIETINTPDYLIFRASHLSKFGGGRGTMVDVDDDSAIPLKFELSQNYPNPFNPSTSIRYSVPDDIYGEDQFVKLVVYDILGNQVAQLVNGYKSPGYYEVEFDTGSKGLTSGVYFCTITAGDFKQTKKMMLMK